MDARIKSGHDNELEGRDKKRDPMSDTSAICGTNQQMIAAYVGRQTLGIDGSTWTDLCSLTHELGGRYLAENFLRRVPLRTLEPGDSAP